LADTAGDGGALRHPGSGFVAVDSHGKFDGSELDADRALRKAGLVRVSEFRLRDRWRPWTSCKRRIETREEIWVVCKQARTIGKSPHAWATIDAELINPQAPFSEPGRYVGPGSCLRL
jgi:hypothetical protein